MTMKKTSPKFYKDELDNPYDGSDSTKAAFWSLERIVYANDESYARAIENGVKLLLVEDSPVPSSITENGSSLETRAVLAYMYMSFLMTTGNDRELIDRINWLEYFKD